MSGKQQRKIDLRLLLQNLRDLDYVSGKVINEYKMKNNILKGGLSDCAACRMYISDLEHSKKEIQSSKINK